MLYKPAAKKCQSTEKNNCFRNAKLNITSAKTSRSNEFSDLMRSANVSRTFSMRNGMKKGEKMANILKIFRKCIWQSKQARNGQFRQRSSRSENGPLFRTNVMNGRGIGVDYVQEKRAIDGGTLTLMGMDEKARKGLCKFDESAIPNHFLHCHY